METKQHTEWSMDQRRNQGKSGNFCKGKWKHNIPKPMGWYKGIPKTEAYSNKCLH